eukprot:TRINITY_DN23467_c1_g1_i2.p1 TRINITY_DN23467_c1_g1~~TRINITY_DN23467_c1_g1_i2.p1  ORF type:complete len:255 (-),score=8.99 TRINITY_DN23467_c1_g1_i2:155-868(-)
MKSTQRLTGWVACYTVQQNNCMKDPGDYWERMRAKYYNSPTINKLWPWMQNVCKETQVNGVPCNAPGSAPSTVTGKCSGIGTNNLIDLVTVNTTGRGNGFTYCGKESSHDTNIVNMNKLNKENTINVKFGPNGGFRNYWSNDLGLKNTSWIYKLRPYYLSCPRAQAGPRRFNQASYFGNFNIPKPVGFDIVLNMTTDHIIDHNLYGTRKAKASMVAAAAAREYSWTLNGNLDIPLAK